MATSNTHIIRIIYCNILKYSTVTSVKYKILYACSSTVVLKFMPVNPSQGSEFS